MTNPYAPPTTVQDASERINLLTQTLAKQWQVMGPDRLDQIAEMMGQREALLAIEKIPPERLTAALLARIASRTEQAKDTVGAGLVAIHAEIAVYVECLREVTV